MNIIGRGGFGKVWKVIDKKTKRLFALKEMQKSKIIDKKSENAIKYERELLTKLNYCFIVNMHYAFQDYDNLYLVLDLLPGGDLRYHLLKQKRFTEEQTKFFIGCMIIALEYIHSNRIIHRDIKPENLVLDHRGYAKITDFGIAKFFTQPNFHETSGTPGYMSPEVIKAQNHSYAVDYYAVGVIGYEFMLGKRPYAGKTRKDFKEQIMMRQAQIKEEEIPIGWPIESADFMNKLLQRKQEQRLGYKGINEIKEHPWLKSFPWGDLLSGKVRSPFTPENKDNFDKKYCEGIDKQGLETKERYEKYKMNYNYSHLFRNFTFAIENKEQPKDDNKALPFSKVELSKKRSISQSAIEFSVRQNEYDDQRKKNHQVNLALKQDKKETRLERKPKRQQIEAEIETITPIPISHNKKYIRSISNMCISPYMMHNKNNKTINNISSLTSIQREPPQDNSMCFKKSKNDGITNTRYKGNNKHNNVPKGYGDLCKFLNQTRKSSVTNNLYEADQVSLSIKMNNNVKVNSSSPSQKKHNPSTPLSMMQVKNVKTSSFTLNSTGGSMSSKFVNNVKDQGKI